MEPLRLPVAVLDDPLRHRGILGFIAHQGVLTGLQDMIDHVRQLLLRHLVLRQDTGCDAGALPDQPQQDMLRPDMAVVHGACGPVSKIQGFTRLFGKIIRHVILIPP